MTSKARSAKPASHVFLLSAVILTVALGVWAMRQALTTYLIVPEGEVPALVGKTAEEAAVLVRQASMTLGLVERGVHTNVPEGEIFWQDPLPGKRVKRGRPIRVLVSLGAQNVAVPDLAGRPLQMVQLTLDAITLRMGSVTEEYDEVVKRRSVIRQFPPAGAFLPVESAIALTISRGPKPVQMPTLVGRSLDDIRIMLERLGLAVTQVAQVASSGANAGTVIAQEPAPGTMIDPRETPIFLVISTSSTVEGAARASSSAAGPPSVETPAGR